jgi:DNA-binding LacI/PurR family transcriptional regulator
MSVTIKQIAKRTGLSIPTVGNVLGRAASRYSAETRQRVLQAAQEMGYRPNSSARAMRNGRIGCAALVLSRSRQLSHSHIPVGLLDGLDDALAQHNMHLTVLRLTDEQLSRDDFLPKVLREYMADGMIVNYTHEIPRAMLELIRAHHTPAVWLNAKLDADCVYPDDLRAAETATAQLIGMGHRRIALLHLIAQEPWGTASFEQARQRFHYSVADRAEGYVQAMRLTGLWPMIVSHDRFIHEAEHVATCRALLSGADRPTAVLVYSDRDLSLLMTTAAQLGLSVPRDLSVLVFYPSEPWIAGKYVSPVAIPTAEIGRRAVQMLLRKIQTPDEPCPADPVHYGALMRDTVAPPTGR